MRGGDGGEEAAFEDGGVRVSAARGYGVWTRLLGCAKPCFMACFDAFSCCASSAPSPPRMRRVTTQTSVERLLPRQDLGDAVMAPPALMRAPSLPLAPRSPEQHPIPRTCAEETELQEEDDLSPKKTCAAMELLEECPLCLEACLSWSLVQSWLRRMLTRLFEPQDLNGDPDNPPMLLACSHRFHLPCLLALEQRSCFCPCCNALMVHPALGRD